MEHLCEHTLASEAEMLLNDFFRASGSALDALNREAEWDLLSLLEKRDALIARLEPMLQTLSTEDASRGELGMLLGRSLDVTTQLAERVAHKRDGIGRELAIIEQTARKADRYRLPHPSAGAKLDSRG